MNCYVQTKDGIRVFCGMLTRQPAVGERLGFSKQNYSNDLEYYRVLTVEQFRDIEDGPPYVVITVEKEQTDESANATRY